MNDGKLRATEMFWDEKFCSKSRTSGSWMCRGQSKSRLEQRSLQGPQSPMGMLANWEKVTDEKSAARNGDRY